jgi:hypothetical protein
VTGIIDAHPMTDGAEPHRGPRGLAGFTPTSVPTALIEQAKGVLIFRYAIAADAAYSLLELWAAQTDATVDDVAHAVVHEICQGDRTVPSDPGLVRWLEERLRHEFPGVECEGSG